MRRPPGILARARATRPPAAVWARARARARGRGACRRLPSTPRRPAVTAPGSLRDETCPVSTGGGTRRVQLVREGGGGVTAPGSAPGRVCAPRANPRRRPPRTRPPQPSAHNGCVRHAPSQFVRGVQIGKVACCMRHAGRQDACSARRGRGGAVLLAFRDLEQRDGTRRGQRARGVRRGRAPRAPGPHAVRQPRSRAPPAPRARARPGGRPMRRRALVAARHAAAGARGPAWGRRQGKGSWAPRGAGAAGGALRALAASVRCCLRLFVRSSIRPRWRSRRTNTRPGARRSRRATRAWRAAAAAAAAGAAGVAASSPAGPAPDCSHALRARHSMLVKREAPQAPRRVRRGEARRGVGLGAPDVVLSQPARPAPPAPRAPAPPLVASRVLRHGRRRPRPRRRGWLLAERGAGAH